MKQSDAIELLSLMKAKTQVEQVTFESLKRRHAAILRTANELRERANVSAMAQPGEFTVSFYKQNEKHVTRLLDAAKDNEELAKALMPDLTVARKRLEHALQKELALENLSDRFNFQARRNANKTEERQQELFRAGQSSTRESQ